MTETLKPCPFCGSTDVEVRTVNDAVWRNANQVACNNCNARTGIGVQRAEVVGEWNRRPATPMEDVKTAVVPVEPVETRTNDDRLTAAEHKAVAHLILSGGETWLSSEQSDALSKALRLALQAPAAAAPAPLPGGLGSRPAQEPDVPSEREAAKVLALINRLREGEGSALTLLCDNPDFDGPNNAVEVVADWTNWQTVRFSGDTLGNALGAAVLNFGGTVMADEPKVPTEQAEGAVVGVKPSGSTVSIESIAKIIRRVMQDNSTPATARSEAAAREIAGRIGYELKRASTTDPMEQLTGDALSAAGIAFITDHEPESPANLDFYLPGSDLHIEVKRFHSERAAEQLRRAENVILLQGKAAVQFFAGLVAPTPASVSPGTEGE